MTESVYEILLDAVDDFIEVESDELVDIGEQIKSNVRLYRDLVNSKIAWVAKILDPRFSNTFSSEEPVQRDFLGKFGYGIGAICVSTNSSKNDFHSFVFDADDDCISRQDGDEVSLFFRETLLKEK